MKTFPEGQKPTRLQKNKYQIALGAVGAFTGIGYSIYKKTGFWKGFGNYILFGFAGILAGTAIHQLTKKS